MRRYEVRSTLMTSNRPLADWGKLLGDVPSATTVLDRFLHHAEVLTFQGKSYRLRPQTSPPADLADEPKPAIVPTGSDEAEPVAETRPRQAKRTKGETGPCRP